MSFQPVPNTAAFTAHFTGPDGTRASFTLYSRNVSGPWGPSQQTTIAEDLANAIEDDYMPFVSDAMTFTNITSRDLEAEFAAPIEHTASNTAGGLASPVLPAEVALRGTFIGEGGAPPRRGGIFMLPPAESQVVGSIVQAGPLASLQTALESLHNAMSSAGPAHVIISRYSGTELVDLPDGQKVKRPVKRPVGLTNTVPTVIVRPRVDSQRKRRPSE